MSQCRCGFSSILAPYIEGLLAEKRALGFSYASEELILTRFDCYCRKLGLDRAEITRDFLSGWLARSPTEGPHNHVKRVSVVRQLLIYMASLGIDVYVPRELPKAGTKLPHIMTADERASFFCQVDSYQPRHGNPAYHRLAQEYKVLFRMIYCCGLRNTEACGLSSDCVDLGTGTLKILESKGRKDRTVYMADDLTHLCTDYFIWLQDTLGYRPEWFFPAMNPSKPLVNTSVDRVFDRFWEATPFAQQCTDKPVVHDLRFSFVTDRVNGWALDGTDVDRMMPYLSKYVGHKDIQNTYYYIHTSESLRDVIARYDVTGSSAIPEVNYGKTQG